MAIFRGMVKDVENTLGVQAVEIGILKSWEMSPPKQASGMKMHEFLGQEVRFSSAKTAK
jgi:hypothetical protein